MKLKNYNKITCCALAFSMTALLFTGCTNANNLTAAKEDSSPQENTFTYTDNTETTPANTSVSGRVSEVNGTSFTLSVMEGGGDRPNGGAPDGEKSDGEKPDGEMPDGEKPDSEMPDNDKQSDSGEKPADGQTPPDIPDNFNENQTNNGNQPQGKLATLTIGDTSVLTASDGSNASTDDITEGSFLTITFDENGVITAIQISEGPQNGKGGGDNASITYQAVNTYNEETTLTDEAISSTGTDENAVLVEGATLNLSDSTIDRTSADSTGGDNASFYGVGAALLATDGTANVSNSTITTDSAGGAGLFAYGQGTIYAENCNITTKQDTSGGIHVAGGGTLSAKNLTVSTEGNSSAAIRSDRGGGTMTVEQGSYTSNGTGSPAVYCTADITVKDATLTANGSEAICIEGLNSLSLSNCDITGNMSDDSQNDTTWNMIVYQSMSGDSEIGCSTLKVSDGSLTAKNGGILYTTNTECNILFSNVDITYANDSEFFLRCTGNQNARGWGQSGANGSQCTFTAKAQSMQGDIIWDSISELDLYMTNGSSLNGAVLDDESCAGDGGNGHCNLYISKDSVWTVTGNSTLTNLYCEGTITDNNGDPVTIQGEDGTTYVKGSSQYIITVKNYSESADLTGAAS